MSRETSFNHPPRGHVGMLEFDPAADAWLAAGPFTGLSSHSGTAADAYSDEVAFDAVADLIVAWAEDEPLDLQLIGHDGGAQDALYVPADSSYRVAFHARGFKCRNHTAGSAADYWIDAFWR